MTSPNKKIVRDFITALGSGDVDTVSTLTHDDMVATAKGSSMLSAQRNKAEIVAGVKMIEGMTKNGIQFITQSMTEEDDRVALHCTGKSVLVTGTPYNNEYIFLITCKDGKIIKMDEFFDCVMVNEILGPLVG